jgi:hypothetical protein
VWGTESDPAVTKKYGLLWYFCSLGATVDLTTVAHRAKLLFSRQYMQSLAIFFFNIWWPMPIFLIFISQIQVGIEKWSGGVLGLDLH